MIRRKTGVMQGMIFYTLTRYDGTKIQARVDSLTLEIDFFENIISRGCPESVKNRIAGVLEELRATRQTLLNLDVDLPAEMKSS